MSLFALSVAQVRRVALPSRTVSVIGSLQWNSLPGSMRWKTTKAEEKESENDITRSQLANTVASLHGLSKAQSQRILKTVFDSIVEVSVTIIILRLAHPLHWSLTSFLLWSCVPSCLVPFRRLVMARTSKYPPLVLFRNIWRKPEP